VEAGRAREGLTPRPDGRCGPATTVHHAGDSDRLADKDRGVDLDLVQSLHQTQRLLAERQDDERFPAFAAAVDAVLAQYQVRTRSQPVAYPEEGADRIDRTRPDGPEERDRVRAALMAFADEPTEANAAHARAALDDLYGTLTG
jgi:hypothetical protein